MLGLEYRAASGTLQQSTITYKSVPVFDEARGNLGRTPIFTQTDLILQHDLPMPGRARVNLGVQFINVFDQDTDTRLFQARYRDAISGVNDAQFFQGFDVAALKAANPAIRNDPRYTLADQFLDARTIRVQAKVIF